MVSSDIFQGVGFWIGVGVVAASALYTLLRFSGSGSGKKSKRPITLKDNQTKYPLKLIEKRSLSHDTRLFRFELPSKQHILGLPVGQHIHLSAMVNDSLVVRAYTPVSSDDDLGHMDLVVKVYFRNVHPKFPDGGKLTQYLNDLPLGHTIDVRGPSGRLVYNGRGEFSIRADKKSDPVPQKAKKINMVAGGSGITPMLQIIKAIFKDPQDESCISLIYANQTEEDILCRQDLEAARDENPGRFKLWYTVDRAPAEGWKYSTGFVSDELMKEHFFPPSDDTIVLMCGPPPMINFACTPNLDKLGYDQDRRFAY